MLERLTFKEAIGLAYKVKEWSTPNFRPSIYNGQWTHQGQLEDFIFEIGMHRVRWEQEYEEVIRPDCHYPFFNELVTVPKPKPSHLLLDGEWYRIKIVSENITVAQYESQESSLEKLYTSITDKLQKDRLAQNKSIIDRAREILSQSQ